MIIKSIEEVVRERIIEASEVALTHFRNAVRTIYGVSSKGNPTHSGSAIFLQLQDIHYLVTAAHVIDWNSSMTLYLGADTFDALQSELLITVAPEGDRQKDHFDFAVVPLDSEIISKLSGAKFITENEISRSIEKTNGRIYTCLGYPNSKNKVNSYKDTKVQPSLGIYTSLGKTTDFLEEIATDHDHILIDHDTQYSCDGSGNQIKSMDLHGFSGGAIIDVGRISPDTLNSNLTPKLAALFIEVSNKKNNRKQCILGTRLSTILGGIQMQ